MNMKSIKFKVTALMAVSLLVIAVSIMSISISRATDSLVKSNMALLDAVKESKKEHITDFFKSFENLLLSRTGDSATVQALWALDESFEELEGLDEVSDEEVTASLLKHYEDEYINRINFKMKGASPKRSAKEYLPKSASARMAQYLYISQNEHKVGEKEKLHMSRKYKEEYSTNHVQIHPVYTRILQNYGLYDIFIVNANGDIVYSVFKEKDFGTNLVSGVYADSGLAEAFRKASKLKKDEVAFTDFRPYEPSYNNPAIFIASPLYFGKDFEGAVIFQLPKKKINDVINFHGNFETAGLGKTGKTTLISMDGTMKNDSRFLKDINNPDVKEAGTTISILKINSKSADAMKKGQSGSWISKDYRGVEVLSSFAPVKIF